MSDDARTDGTENAGPEDEGLGAGGAAAAAAAGGVGGATAATVAAGNSDEPSEVSGTGRGDRGDGTGEALSDTSRDAESARGMPDGSRGRSTGEQHGPTIIGEPEAYAATEPVRAEDQSPPVTPEPVPGNAGRQGHPSSESDRRSAGDVGLGDERSAADRTSERVERVEGREGAQRTERTDVERTTSGATAVSATATGRSDEEAPPASAERRDTTVDRTGHEELGESERGGAATQTRGDAPAMTVIGEPEAYAATEPVRAEDQTPPVSPQTGAAEAGASGEHPSTEGSAGSGLPDARGGAASDVGSGDRDVTAGGQVDRGDRSDRSDRMDRSDRDDVLGGDDEADSDHAPAETGARVASPDESDRTAADRAERPTEERYDPTPSRDWGADEGELLDENHERSERLRRERDELPDGTTGSGPGSASGAGTAGRDGGDARVD